MKWINILLYTPILLAMVACDNYFKNDHADNSPTSGELRVYYDEGLRPHVLNQTLTFGAHYPQANVQLIETNESAAVQALFHDSCEAIFIARNLTAPEQKLFASKHYTPSFSHVAYTGVAVIVHQDLPLRLLSVQELSAYLSGAADLKDSTGGVLQPQVLFDRNNSGVLHYITDTVLRAAKLSSNCSVLASSLESINYVASHPNSMALVDFAWLSDSDDSLVKANQGKIRMLALSGKNPQLYEYPHQSSFKLGTYPFTRHVFVIRKTGEFSLAKGFESFVMGPKGQMTFLKQGLMPARQSERNIRVNLGDPADKEEKPEN